MPLSHEARGKKGPTMNRNAETAGNGSAGAIEAFIRIAHRVARHGRYHPYFLASDLGLIVTLGLTATAGNLWGTTDWWRLAAPLIVFHLIGYPLYLKLKLKVVKTPARSFLQDTLLFILPGYLLAMLALGVPMRTATDYLALCLPVTLAFHRIGCLVGGCCYGRPSLHGISYDPDLVAATRTPWRRFDPGPAPAERVFPLQLTDAAVNVAIAAALYTLAHSNPPTVPLLPLYLAAYSAARLIMEPFRGHRHRPLYRHASEAQLTAFLVTTLSALWIGLALALLQKLNGWGLCLLDHSRRTCVNCVAGGSTPET